MYWFSVRKLADDLREGRVNEYEQFKYYLATFVAVNVLVYFGGSSSMDDLASTALNVCVTILGIIVCYRVNKRGDNTDFVNRMICLSWPAGVQAAVTGAFLLFLPCADALRLALIRQEAVLPRMLDTIRDTWSHFWAIIFLIAYYFFLIHDGLARIARTEADEDREEESERSPGALRAADNTHPQS
jgi:uncharacterized membrane protein YfcA